MLKDKHQLIVEVIAHMIDLPIFYDWLLLESNAMFCNLLYAPLKISAEKLSV